MIEKYSQNMMRMLDQYLDHTSDDPVTCIKNIHYYMIGMLEKDGQQGCLLGNLSAEIGNSSKICQMTMKHAHAAWKKRYAKLIEEAQAQNLIRKDLSADMLADILWSTWQGGLLKIKTEGEPALLKQMMDVTVDVLFK